MTRKVKKALCTVLAVITALCGINLSAAVAVAEDAGDYDTEKNLLIGAQIVRLQGTTPDVDGENIKCGMLIQPGSSSEQTLANATIVDGSLTNTSNYHTIGKSVGNKASFRIKFSEEKNIRQIVITTRKQGDGTGLIDDSAQISFAYSSQVDSWWSGSFNSEPLTVTSYEYVSASTFKRTVIDLTSPCSGKDFLLEISRDNAINIIEIEVYEEGKISGPAPSCRIDDITEPPVRGRNYIELTAESAVNSLVGIPIKKVEFFDNENNYIGEGIKSEDDGKYHFVWKNLDFEHVYQVKARAADFSGVVCESNTISFELAALSESDLIPVITEFDTIVDYTNVAAVIEKYSEILENVGFKIADYTALEPLEKEYFEKAIVNYDTGGVYSSAEFYNFADALKNAKNMIELAFCEDNGILQKLKDNKEFYKVDVEDKYFNNFDGDKKTSVLTGLKETLNNAPQLTASQLDVKFMEFCALQSFGDIYWGEYYDWINHFNNCLMIDLIKYDNELTDAERVKVMQNLAAFTSANSAEAIKNEFDRLVLKAINERGQKTDTVIDNPYSGGGGSGGGGSKTKVVYNSDDTKKDSSSDNTAADTGIKADLPFNDIKNVEWARESIEYLYIKNIISGTTEKTFEPQRSVTREEFLKMLLGILNIKPQENDYAGFEDTEPNAWYNGYIAAAKEIGIINGISETQFGVGQNIKRQDMILMIFNGLNAVEKSADSRESITFSDEKEIDNYAKFAIKALSGAGMINGNEDGCFMPHKNATRAEAAAVLYKAALLTENTGA